MIKSVCRWFGWCSIFQSVSGFAQLVDSRDTSKKIEIYLFWNQIQIFQIITCFFVDGLDEAQFIQSARGFAQLVDKSGYIYTRHQSKKSRTWWKCVEKTSKTNPCNARATTEGFNITKYFKTHTHPPPMYQGSLAIE